MLETLTNWLINRRLSKSHINVNDKLDIDETSFIRVMNTLRTNRIMVKKEDDGIYIRMAGNEKKDECFSLEWAKVKSFKNSI